MLSRADSLGQSVMQVQSFPKNTVIFCPKDGSVGCCTDSRLCQGWALGVNWNTMTCKW